MDISCLRHELNELNIHNITTLATQLASICKIQYYQDVDIYITYMQLKWTFIDKPEYSGVTTHCIRPNLLNAIRRYRLLSSSKIDELYITFVN